MGRLITSAGPTPGETVALSGRVLVLVMRGTPRRSHPEKCGTIPPPMVAEETNERQSVAGTALLPQAGGEMVGALVWLLVSVYSSDWCFYGGLHGALLGAAVVGGRWWMGRCCGRL